MDNIISNNEFVEIDGRAYPNPQVALDESNAFIDNLRSTQQANNQEIQTQTYNLGSELPSQLGGLGTPGDASLSYFTSRYQVPQTASAVANLRATAQAAALNQVLENEQAKWKKRYSDAYRNYQKSAYNRSYGGGGNTTYTTAGQGDVEKEATESPEVSYGGSVTAIPGYHTVISPDGIAHLINNETGEEITITPPTNAYNTGVGGMGWSGGSSGNGGIGGR